MKRYVIAGILVFLCVLIAGFPARVAYNWFAPPAVNLTGLSGSVWHGTAEEGLASGAYFRNLNWKFRPGALLSGALAFDLSAQPAGGQIAAVVSVTAAGGLKLSDLNGALPLELVHQTFQKEGIRGDVALAFNELVLENGIASQMDGKVEVNNFFVPNLSAAPLGNYAAQFQAQDGSITANVTDTAGVLEVEGVLTVTPDQSYSFVGDVGARPGSPPSIEDQLRFLGSPDNRGMRQFRFEGSL